MADRTDHEEALRLKTLAEQNYTTKNFKSALEYAELATKIDPCIDGLPEMLTAFKIICAAETPIFLSTAENSQNGPPDYYGILQLERFSHVNTIKKQYKKLALTLHPDKNQFVASEEAFKLVGEATSVLSDNIRRKEYDTRLRILMQSQAAEAIEVCTKTFRTACSTCCMLLQFERKYLEHRLLCPSCKKFFKAVEVEENPKTEENVRCAEVEEGVEVVVPTRVSARIQERVVRGEKVEVSEKFDLGVKRKISTLGEILDRLRVKVGNIDDGNSGAVKGVRSKRVEEVVDLCGSGSDSIERLKSKEPGKAVNNEESEHARSQDEGDDHRRDGLEVRNGVEEGKQNVGFAVYVRGRTKRAKALEEEAMTLAEMKKLVKQKKVGGDNLTMKKEKCNSKEKSQHKEEQEKRKVKDGGKKKKSKENDGEDEKAMKGYKMENGNAKKGWRMRDKRGRQRVSEDGRIEAAKIRAWENNVGSGIEIHKTSEKDDLVIMPVQDSEFHDFDHDRKEKSFKKGQVWAAYDDDDAMPRHYALIHDVSVNPFELTLSWLEFQCDGNHDVTNRQNTGFHSSCGKFKVCRKVSVNYLNLFSHLVDNERIARELCMIYPRKGTVWALYLVNDVSSERRNSGVEYKQGYEIIVSLSTFSGAHGLSIAFLEKIDGFRTLYKRREIGANGVKFLAKEDMKLFSHQIPAKKLSGEEASSLPEDCWELDPASVTPPLQIGHS